MNGRAVAHMPPGDSAPRGRQRFLHTLAAHQRTRDPSRETSQFLRALGTLAGLAVDQTPVLGDVKAVALDAPRAFRRGDIGSGLLALASAIPGIPALQRAKRTGDEVAEGIAREAERRVSAGIDRRARQRAFDGPDRRRGGDRRSLPGARVGGELEELRRLLEGADR